MALDNNAMFSLEGKVAIITGASRGIGEAIAHGYSTAGARVVIASRKQKGVDDAVLRVRESGGQALGVVCNVSDHKDRIGLVEKTIQWAGQIDILVNNAGTNPTFGPLDKITESSWDKLFDVNVKGSFFLAQHAYQAWMKNNGGAILNIVSVGGYQAITGINAYNVSKAALMHITRCMASEWGPDGVRVNAIAPGLIKTQMSKVLVEGPLGIASKNLHPIRRIGNVSDITGAALLLVTDAAQYITGQVLSVDGGQLLLSSQDTVQLMKSMEKNNQKSHFQND